MPCLSFFSRWRRIRLAAFAMIIVALSLCLNACPPPIPAGNATIYRDVFGVSHIYADGEYNVLYGLGYAMARDQLKTMMTQFRASLGVLAEKEGLGEGNGHVVGDFLAKVMRVPENAEETFAAMSDEEKQWLIGFTAGINTYIEEYNRSHDPDYEQVTPKAVIARGFFIQLGDQLTQAQQEFAEEVEFDFKLAHSTAINPADTGSNQWAVSAARTGSVPMTHADPHLVWRGATQWYEVHLKDTSGELNVTGAAILGTPFVSIGRNEHVAWSLTSNTPSLDFVDVYKEKLLRPNDYSTYVYDPEPKGHKPLINRAVSINVKGIPIPLIAPVYYTHHGFLVPVGIEGFRPVYTQDGTHVYAFALCMMDSRPDQYPGPLQGRKLLSVLHRLNTARNVNDVKAAFGLSSPGGVSSPEEPLQFVKWNVMAADVDGNLFYLYNGRCPIRERPHDEDLAYYERPVPGWTGFDEWKRDQNGDAMFWPVEQLPRIENPSSGIMVNCNVAPWYVSPGVTIDPAQYPPYLVHDEITDRNIRARILLENDPQISERDMRVYSMDVHILRADQMEALLFSFFDPVVYPDLVDAAALLQNEPNEATTDNRSILLMHRWFAALGVDLFAYPLDPAQMTDAQRDALIAALRIARDELTACGKGIAQPWGDVHSINTPFVAPLDGGTGRVQTLFLTGARYEDCLPFDVDGGSSFMQLSVLEPGAVISRALRPLSANDSPSSPFYKDETTRYVQRDPDSSYRPDVFADNDVQEVFLFDVTTLPH